MASELGVTIGMVKLHRGRVMEKMQAGSLAELIRLADQGSSRGEVVTSPIAGIDSAPREG